MIPPAIQILSIFILVLLAAGILPRVHKEGTEEMLALREPSLIAKQKAKKEANKKKVLELFAGMPEGKLTNFDIEILLDVSDATAARYLEELEKEGKVRKVGGLGRQMYYEKIL